VVRWGPFAWPGDGPASSFASQRQLPAAPRIRLQHRSIDLGSRPGVLAGRPAAAAACGHSRRTGRAG
jgi:hypothetical protein